MIKLADSAWNEEHGYTVNTYLEFMDRDAWFKTSPLFVTDTETDDITEYCDRIFGPENWEKNLHFVEDSCKNHIGNWEKNYRLRSFYFRKEEHLLIFNLTFL